MPIKVMFINTINPYEEIEYRYPPLGIGYLVNSLRNHFGNDTFQFKVVDRNIGFELLDFKPDIVGITSVTQNYNIARKYASVIKSKGIPVIIGGIHISMLPSSLTVDMDLAVIGEGEKTIINIFELFLRKKIFTKEDLSKIKGIAYRNRVNKLVVTEKQNPIFPLDNISIPARDLFKIKSHSYLFSSRGCPYHCIFCASSHFWNNVRFFSANYVFKEIKELVEKYDVRLISFYDDLMILDKERLQKLVVLLKNERILNKIRFSLNARANLLTEEVVGLLKEMNVVSVGMGLESGNERILRYLKGNNISIYDNRVAIKNLKKYKIAANASFVIGSPDETKEEMVDTFNFIKMSGLNFFDTYVLTPFPGTPIWEFAKKTGSVNDSMDWAKLNVNFESNHKKAVIISQTLTREEIYSIFLKFQKLRLFLAMKNLLWHPFLFDICGFLIEKFIAKFKMLKNKRKLIED
jgi:radical SAM superfamily enzyme YgiQ (UPF0313 family)